MFECCEKTESRDAGRAMGMAVMREFIGRWSVFMFVTEDITVGRCMRVCIYA